MEQYFAGRTAMKIAEISSKSEDGIEDRIFANERADSNWNHSHLKVFNTTFAKMGFKDSKFRQCDVSFCVFIDCYFKKTYFEQTKFISCIFINCNFDMAIFVSCDFRYATFSNCFIPYAQMKSNLPHGQENLCADICRNLSTQCLQLGEISDYKAYLFEERAAGEVHSIRKLFHESNVYYNKYTFWEGLEGLFDYVRSKLSKFLWGYGEKMGALLRNMLFVILGYTVFFYIQSGNIQWSTMLDTNIVSAFYLSACNFFSLAEGSLVTTQFMRFIVLSEHILGAVLMGFFVAALFRQINRRR